jgi:hypothetical protein
MEYWSQKESRPADKFRKKKIRISLAISSTDPILALALAMSICTHCAAILTQSYGISSIQLWHFIA